MVNLDLCFETQNAGEYIIPSLLPQHSPGLTRFGDTPINQWLLFRYRYSFMPKGMISRITVRMNRYIMGKMMWRYGVALQIGEAQAEILENAYRKELRIRITGQNKTEALAVIREEIKALHDTFQYLDPEELIPCNCSQCSNLRNPCFYSYALLKEYRRTGRYKIVCERSLEDVVLHGLIGELTPPPGLQPPLYDRVVRAGNKKDDAVKKRNKLLVAFARADKQWLDRVKTHLKEFEDEGFELDIWNDLQLNAGKKWERGIAEVFEEIKIVVLLVTTDFLVSDFIVKNELPPLLETAEQQGAVILPLIIKPCRFARNLNLAQFQTINDPERPLISLSESGQEEALLRLTETIDEQLRDINPTLTR
jgi:hypothetical protein